MKFLKIKKNKKGFTLVEMLIAMTIFAIMSMLMAVVFAAAAKLNIRNHKMNNQMQEQGNTVEQADTTKTVDKNDQTITFSINGKSVNVDIEKYHTADMNASPDNQSDLKFYKAKP